MEEDKKIENIKDGCKISVPIISNQELDDFNNILDIETEHEKLIKKVSEQVYKEKECILLQQIIKKQEQTIENLIARNKELEEDNKKYERANDYLQTLNHKYYEDNVTLLRKNGKVDILADNIHFKYIDMVENYIPKSKVREKIEQIKMNANYDWIYKYDYQDVTKILEELLQEGDK